MTQKRKIPVGMGMDARWRFAEYWKIIQSDLVDFASVIGIFDLADVQHVQENLPSDMQVIHHLSDAVPASPSAFNIQHLNWINHVNKKLNVQWCCEDIGYWSHLGNPVSPVLDEDSLQLTSIQIIEMKKYLHAPFLPEFPSFSGQVGTIDLCTWLQRLCEQADIQLVLDTAHFYQYQCFRNEADWSGLLPYIGELHISGGMMHPEIEWRYQETHRGEFHPAVLEMTRALVEQAPNLRAVTYEFVGGETPWQIQRNLEVLQQICG